MTSWQDLAFASGGAFFTLALIPTIRNPKAAIPRATSIPTAAFLALFVATHLSLHLHLAAVLETCACLAWCWIALTKAPRSHHVSIEIASVDKIEAALRGVQRARDDYREGRARPYSRPYVPTLIEDYYEARIRALERRLAQSK